jgi:hypothetical protein
MSRRLQFLGVLLATLLCRLPSLVDPPWVNDEGTYFAVAQAMAHGYRLYDGVWENKPPALYLVYSAIYHSTGPSLTAVRLLTAALVCLLVALAWRLGGQFCGPEWSPAVALGVGLLFGVPFLEGTTGNAEVFVALLAAAAVDAALLRHRPTVGGLLIGLAVLFKVVAVFDAAAIGLWLLLATGDVELPLRIRPIWASGHGVRLGPAIAFAACASAVVALACLGAALAGDLGGMIKNALLYDVGYVGHGNGGGVPWLLALKVVLLAALTVWAMRRPFPVLWLLFAAFGALFSGRVFGHYLLQAVLPGVLSLTLVAPRREQVARRAPRVILALFVALACVSALAGAALARIQGTSILTSRLQYYANAVRLATGRESYATYRDQVDDHVSRNERVAAEVRRLATGRMLVWGNTPWIYVLSGRLPATPYTSSLRTPEVPGETTALRQAVATGTPRVVVVIGPPLPPLGSAASALHEGYRRVATIRNASIYLAMTRSRAAAP